MLGMSFCAFRLPIPRGAAVVALVLPTFFRYHG